MRHLLSVIVLLMLSSFAAGANTVTAADNSPDSKKYPQGDGDHYQLLQDTQAGSDLELDSDHDSNDGCPGSAPEITVAVAGIRSLTPFSFDRLSVVSTTNAIRGPPTGL